MKRAEVQLPDPLYQQVEGLEHEQDGGWLVATCHNPEWLPPPRGLKSWGQSATW